jgi:predicted ATPase
MITRLKVQGFKNLKDVDIRFGLFTCIAGANGVGKSNLFDAICFLSDLASMPIIQAASRVRGTNGQMSDLNNLFSSGCKQIQFLVEAIVPKHVEDDFDRAISPTATFLEYGLTIEYSGDQTSKDPIVLIHEELRHKGKPKAQADLKFTAAPDFGDYESFIRTFIVSPKNRTTPYLETDLEGSIRLFGEGGRGALQKVPARKSPQTVLAGVNTNSHPTALAMRREFQSWRLMQLEPSALRTPDEFGSKSLVEHDGAHVAAALHRTGAYAEVARRLSGFIPGVELVDVDSNEARKTRAISLQIKGRRFPASALSDGTLRFLALSVIASDPEATGLLCMEEPENGIHPQKIPEMVQLVRELSDAEQSWQDQSDPLRQVIINTHSPLVVKELRPDELVMADTYIESGHPWVRFKSIEDTWRANYAGPILPRGKVKTYLEGWARQDEMQRWANMNEAQDQRKAGVRGLFK